MHGLHSLVTRRLLALTAFAALLAATARAGDCPPSLAGEAVDVSDATVSQRLSPQVAYNAIDDQYMIVWFDTRNPGNNDIFGQVITADATLIGANFPIIEFADAQIDPSIAHSPAANRYLVAWRTQHGGAFNHGYGRILESLGEPVTGQFFVSEAGFESSIAYNAAADEFFHEARNFAGGGPGGIRGRRIDTGGNLLGVNIAIATAGAPAPAGEVAYDSVNNQYLATWRNQDARNLQGQRIDAAGNLIGGPIIIWPSFPGSGRPTAAVAFSPADELFLVAFGDFSGPGIRGQFVSSEGDLVGGPFFITNDGGNSTTPEVVYVETADVFLVGWNIGGIVSSQAVSSEGALVGDPLVVVKDGTASGTPSMAYNTTDGEVLVAWSDNRAPGAPDIFVQRVEFACCQPCDANCDGVVDAFDIEPFIGIFGSPIPPCSPCAGDTNGDGVVDAFDIEPFINCLVGP